MPQDLRDFWHRFQSGVDIGVAGNLPDKLLGVRDGFLRYFQHRYPHGGPIRVRPHPWNEADTPLPLADLEILELARRRAHELRRTCESEGGAEPAFYVGSETGLLTIRLDDETRHLVRTWTIVLGLGEEAWGSSGSLQLPARLIGGLDEDRIPYAIPGTRRSGGMASSLTGGLESRRTGTSLSTFHALSTLTYGLHASRPERGSGRGGLYRV